MVQQGRSLLSSSGDALRLGLLVALAAVISLCLRVSVARALRLSPVASMFLSCLVSVSSSCFPLGPESPVMPRSEGGELCQLSPVGVLLILSDLAAPPRPRPALRASPSLRGPSRARPVPWSAPGPGSPVMPRSEAADLASSPVPSVCSPYRVISLHLRALVLLPISCQPVAPWSVSCLSRPDACRPWAWVSSDSQVRGWQVPPAPRVLRAQVPPVRPRHFRVFRFFSFSFLCLLSHYATAVMLPRGSPRRAPVPLVIRALSSRLPLQPPPPAVIPSAAPRSQPAQGRVPLSVSTVSTACCPGGRGARRGPAIAGLRPFLYRRVSLGGVGVGPGGKVAWTDPCGPVGD